MQKPKTIWKNRSVLLVTVFIAIVSVVGWLHWRQREPSYHGKRLSYWLARGVDNSVLEDPKNPGFTECQEALRTIGTNAMPTLLRILRSKDSGLKNLAVGLAERQSYVRIPLRSSEAQKQKALVGFYLLGDLATNAVPALVDIYQHPATPFSRSIAQRILMRLYPAESVAVPYWVEAQNRPEWYRDVGAVLVEAGALSNAVLAFSQAMQLEPTNVLACLSRGQTRLELQDFAGARMDYERVMGLSPSNKMALLGRGACRFSQKDFRGAEADFAQVIHLESNDFTAFKYRGIARANLRNLGAALADFDMAIELNSYDAEVFRNRAAVEALQTEFESALADASKSLELDDQDAMAWILQSRLQCVFKNYPAAVTNANRAVELGPNDSNAYAARAAAFMCMDEFAKSAADVETAIKLSPGNAAAFVVRGVLCAKRGGDDEAALADLRRAVALAPEQPETCGMLGLFQYKALQWEPALANCRKALQLGAVTGVSDYKACIWLIQARRGEEAAANKELKDYLNSLDSSKTNEWSAITARFLSGSLTESNFLSLASTAAKRPSAIKSQVCESLFYAAMKRKFAGDTPGAREMLQKCLDTKYDNSIAYFNAAVEMRSLKGP